MTDVTVPARALSFAEAATRAGWVVEVTTARGPKIGNDGEVVREQIRTKQDVEHGGGVRITAGEPKVVETVAVRCRRGTDYLYALWEDGSFACAVRPKALRRLSSLEALDHVRNSPDRACRWLPASRRGTEVCQHHGETRGIAPLRDGVER